MARRGFELGNPLSVGRRTFGYLLTGSGHPFDINPVRSSFRASWNVQHRSIERGQDAALSCVRRMSSVVLW